MPLLPVRRIWEIAYFDPQIRARVALELRASRPIPVHEQGSDPAPRLMYRFFYFAAYGPPPAPRAKLWPPSWWVWIDAETGAIRGPEERVPQDFGIDGPRDQPFADHAWPKEWTWQDADRKREELLADYDRVVPLWDAAVRAGKAQPGAGPADFRARFLELTEPPLLPCYRLLGPDFFAWVGI
jgi:hypothetical protein